jgi:predicted dehydrogenase
MIPGFRAAAESATLLAVASRSTEKAQAVAARHGVERSYGSYEKLLADSDIEAVYIPLPNDQHTQWTLRALAAGKHVLCDKPGALTYADAVQMAGAAKASDLRLMEGFMYRHHPQHARIAAIVASGEIGAAVHVEGTFTYPAAYDPANIRWNLAQGGGAMLDTGVYPLNAARLYLGEPIAVSAVARRDATTGVDRATVVLMEFADGQTATVQGAFDQAFTSRYEVRGTTGVISAERAFQVGDIDQYGREIAHFSACVRDASLPLAPGEDGVAQARVVEAVGRAARERRRVEIAEIVASA